MKHLGTHAAAKHPLMYAYELIFDVTPEGEQFFLERDTLARRFLAKAMKTHPDRATDTDRPRAELTDAFRELEAAFKLLLEILGSGDSVLVNGLVADIDDEALAKLPDAQLTRPRPVKGWQARPTPSVLARDVTDLRTMKERAVRRQVARRVNELRATEAYAQAETETETALIERKAEPLPVSAPPSDKRFMLGRHLLRSGRITLRQLVDAVLWQRAQRPRVGELAIEWGIMTKAEVFFVLREKTVDEMFCDVAVRLGFLTTFQRLAILARQRRMQLPIGRYFVDNGILESTEVEAAVDEARELAREAGVTVGAARP